MTNPFLIHLVVALVWLFLSGETTLPNLLLSLVLTYVLLVIFRKPLRCEGYVRRTVALARFLVRLLLEIVDSNLRLMVVALRADAPQLDGYFLSYDVEGLSESEVLLLSLCVGLSPGTIAVEREEGGRRLILHVYPAGDPDMIRRKTDQVLKRGILSFTR